MKLATLPRISLIVPTISGKTPENLLASLKKIHYPQSKIEMLVVYGNQPSHQRNLGAKKAQGRILYFIDDDSIINPTAIRLAVKALADQKIVAIGGPALTRKGASFWEKCFGFIQGSILGGWHTRYRHRAIGQRPRIVRGEELILCNLFIRKKVYLKEKGLKELLYPNEENEFFKRLAKKGYQFVYHPRLISWRPRRKNIFGFARQNFNYGRGRMEHFWENFRAMDIFFIVPIVFVFYLITLIFYHPWWFLLPLGAYGLLALLTGSYFAVVAKKAIGTIALPPLFLVAHGFYGAGFLWGFLKQFFFPGKRARLKVQIVRVKHFIHTFGS